MPRLPRVPLPAGLILAPGAGADRDDPTLVALARGLPELPVVRLTLATTSVPNAVAKVRAAAVELATALDVSPERLAFGGRSFGGRACSVAVADGLAAALQHAVDQSVAHRARRLGVRRVAAVLGATVDADRAQRCHTST